MAVYENIRDELGMLIAKREMICDRINAIHNNCKTLNDHDFIGRTFLCVYLTPERVKQDKDNNKKITFLSLSLPGWRKVL